MKLSIANTHNHSSLKYLKIKHKNKIPPDQEAGGEFVD